MTIACVLRSGGQYTPDHVKALHRAVGDVDQFVVLTDLEGEFETPISSVRLLHDWPGWWSKIELFRPGLFNDRILFLDLDTVICGPVGELIETDGTVMLKDFRLGSPSSAVMAWDAGEMDHVYEAFVACPDPMDKRHKPTDRQKVYGDQSWIHKCIGDTGYRFFQDILPGRLHLAHDVQKGKPAGASVICFAGSRKPWRVNDWTRDYYRG